MTGRVAIVLEGQVLRNAYSVVFHNMLPSIEARIHMRALPESETFTSALHD